GRPVAPPHGDGARDLRDTPGTPGTPGASTVQRSLDSTRSSSSAILGDRPLAPRAPSTDTGTDPAATMPGPDAPTNRPLTPRPAVQRGTRDAASTRPDVSGTIGPRTTRTAPPLPGRGPGAPAPAGPGPQTRAPTRSGPPRPTRSPAAAGMPGSAPGAAPSMPDRKSTRLNSSHV